MVQLEQGNIVNLIIGITVIAGWFINSWLNRRNEIAKERRSVKAEYQKKVVEFWSQYEHRKFTYNKESDKIINELEPDVYIYGGKEDIKAFQELIIAYKIMKNNLHNGEKKPDLLKNFEESVNKFKDAVVMQFREELELGEYNPKFEGRNI